MDYEPLAAAFYARSAATAAPALLGHLLLHRISGEWVGGPILETEAYLAGDPASHSFRGRTARNNSMFLGPGHCYVYLIYGLHHGVNAVCGPEGVGEAVLIRAIAPQFGPGVMKANRPHAKNGLLTNGPAKLCQALGIGRAQDGLDLTGGSQLTIMSNPERQQFLAACGPVQTTTRIGITRAAEEPLRWFINPPIKE